MLKTSVLQRGQGKDLLFLHGYGASKECFLRQINYFSKFYRVTAFDFPGFGQSESPATAWSVGDYAVFTREKLNEWQIHTPCVVAHSFGARVAVKMAAGENCFEKMVLTGAAGIIPPRGVIYRMKVGAYRATKRLFPAYAERHFGSEEYKKLSPVERESYKKIVNEDLRYEAEKIDVPVLFIYGEKDTTTPVKSGMVYCSHVKDSQLCVMPECGHFAFLDDEISFNRITEEFLELKYDT
jgi:pimeloyl-ACP methyl ester carboxylesterase